DGDPRGLPAQSLPRAARLRLQRITRLRAFVPDPNAGDARRHAGPPLPGLDGHRGAGAEGRSDGLSLERAEGPLGEDGATGARLPEGASTRGRRPLRPAGWRRSTAPPCPPSGRRPVSLIGRGVWSSREDASGV